MARFVRIDEMGSPNLPRLRTLLPIILCQLLFAPDLLRAADIERQISHIQNGLLPPVLVKGESAKATPLAARMEALHVPGVSIAVIRDGKIHWARGFGVTRIGGSPVTPDTLFQAASISKVVSAVGAMHLVQTKRLDLDADINNYLKTWTLPDNELTQQAKVTLRGLLTHSAGITAHPFQGYEAGMPLPTVVQVLNGEPPANSPPIRVDMVPGKTWRYSNGGYVVVEQAMTDVSGIAFPKLMENLVLRPFGMKHSTYQQPLPAHRLAEIAMPYRWDGSAVKGGPHVYPELAPSGLWTTPSDLASFAIGMQRALSGKARRVLSAANARTMLEPAFNRQAIGFVVGGRTERKWLNHSGGTEGYNCILWAYQDGQDGAVIMTNSDGAGLLITEITRTIAHEYGWPDFAPPERVLNGVDPKSFDQYVGAYEFQNGRIFTVWRDGAQIRSRIMGQAPLDVFPTSEQEYFAKVTDARLIFSDGAEGSAITAVLVQDDREQPMKRLETAASRVALDWSLATEKRFRQQTPATGSEVALRHLIAGLASGSPTYDEMTADFAQTTRQLLPTLHHAVLRFGALQAVSFKRVLASGWDRYEVKFANATRDFSIYLQADGRVFGAYFSQ